MDGIDRWEHHLTFCFMVFGPIIQNRSTAYSNSSLFRRNLFNRAIGHGVMVQATIELDADIGVIDHHCGHGNGHFW